MDIKDVENIITKKLSLSVGRLDSIDVIYDKFYDDFTVILDVHDVDNSCHDDRNVEEDVSKSLNISESDLKVSTEYDYSVDLEFCFSDCDL